MHAVLARFPSEWLLIFDNAPDMDSVAAFQPPAGSGRVLITSQNQNWPGQALDVPVLDPEVAAGFLVSRSGDRDRQAAAELARELAGLPLALEQAGAYVKASSGSLADYLAAFQQRRRAVLERGEPTGYGKTVATTWSLAFQQLEESEPSAVGLLRLLAWCAPEAVPLGLLLQPRPWLAEKLDERSSGFAGAAARGPAGRLGRDRRPAQVLAGHPGWRRPSLGSPAGTGRHRRSDARRVG